MGAVAGAARMRMSFTLQVRKPGKDLRAASPRRASAAGRRPTRHAPVRLHPPRRGADRPGELPRAGALPLARRATARRGREPRAPTRARAGSPTTGRTSRSRAVARGRRTLRGAVANTGRTAAGAVRPPVRCPPAARADRRPRARRAAVRRSHGPGCKAGPRPSPRRPTRSTRRRAQRARQRVHRAVRVRPSPRGAIYTGSHHEDRNPSRVRRGDRDAAHAGTRSRPARPRATCTWRSAPTATPSTRASRSSSTPAAASSASSAAPPSAQRGQLAPPGRGAGCRSIVVSTRPPTRLTAQRDAPVGGQAVMEGVMMRGVSTWAVAVRSPTARSTSSRSRSSPWTSATACCGWPVVRGVVALAESLTIGFKALGISANAQLEEDEEPISGAMWVGTLVVALSFAVGLFFVVPVALTSLVKDQLGSALLFWLVEGVVRTAIFLGYLVVIVAPARPAARVRVPRRRAQDDRLLRGRRAARRPRTRSASRACTRAAGRASC